MKKLLVIIMLLLVLGVPFALAKNSQYKDGTYDAFVVTDSGSYTVPVDVADNQVVIVHWPNGGGMHVYGASISGDSASGTNSNGDAITIELSSPE
jgi:hypothetical protein